MDGLFYFQGEYRLFYPLNVLLSQAQHILLRPVSEDCVISLLQLRETCDPGFSLKYSSSVH